MSVWGLHTKKLKDHRKYITVNELITRKSFPSLVLQMRGNYSRALCHDSLQ